MEFNTKLIHDGTSKDTTAGAVSASIYQTLAFEQNGADQPKEYEYSRSGNSTRHTLEILAAESEDGSHGFAFSSDLAGIHTTISMFGPEDHILLGGDAYGGSFRLLDEVFVANGLSHMIVSANDLSIIEAAIQPDTKALFLETLGGPLLKTADIEAAVKLTKKYQSLTIVDSIFTTPYFQRPLALGANIAVHSGTKYLGGHSDVVPDSVVTNHPESTEKIAFLRSMTNAVLGPYDSWLAQRGLKALSIRMAVHAQNTQKIVGFLEAHPAVATVYYPGLASHLDHEIAQKRMSGFSGIIPFKLARGEQVVSSVEALEIFTLTESLDDVESLIKAPAIMTHASIPKENHEAAEIKGGLIRLSVGIEAVEDLLANLERGL